MRNIQEAIDAFNTIDTKLDSHDAKMAEFVCDYEETIRKALQQAIACEQRVVHVSGDIDMSNFDMSAGVIIPEPVNQWRPISEAPKDGSPILGILDKYKTPVVMAYSDYSGTFRPTRFSSCDLYPTYWMPLPV